MISRLLPPKADGSTMASMDNHHTKLLVVDDDPALRQLLADYLNRHGYDTLLAPDASDLPSRITRYAPDPVSYTHLRNVGHDNPPRPRSIVRPRVKTPQVAGRFGGGGHH